ncbi:MAG: c-type cytochrome [Pseudomonadota bacterium]
MFDPIHRTAMILSAAGAMALAWASPSLAQAQEPAPNAALIAANCAVCHGQGGAGAGDIVKINDKTPAQIVEAMGAFRDGKKPSTIMGRITKGYSDTQITAVATHLGKK